MTETVTLSKVNEVDMHIRCSQGVLQELSDHFSYETKGAKFRKGPARGGWDGRFRLVSTRTNTLLLGLQWAVVAWCKDNGYNVVNNIPRDSRIVSYEEFEAFTKTLNLPEDRTPYDFQIKACINVINDGGRALILSPTSSGKSLMQYLLFRWYNERMIIVVPSTNLVLQMRADFKSYNYEDDVSIIKAGESKIGLNKITVSTWQSLPAVTTNWLNQFKVIMIDEAHGAEAKSIAGLLKKATGVSHRIGATGTLDEESKTNAMQLTGLFGKSYVAATTRELMDRGIVSELDITCVELMYPEDFSKSMRKRFIAYKHAVQEIKEHNKINLKKDHLPLPPIFYTTELNEIIGDMEGTIPGYDRRQRFIAKLACKLEGNTLVLFRYVRHGKKLFELINKFTNKKTFLIYGEVKAETREEIRQLLEKEDNIVVVASYATLSTGVSINNLHHIVFAAPIKGMIKVLQSIGRVLRLHKSKAIAKLYDIGDNFSVGRYSNYAYRHFAQRIGYYVKEKFNYKIVKVNL